MANINLTTSVLAYDQFEYFAFQPYATGLDASISPLVATPENLAELKPSAAAATTANISGCTYDNGTGGVGATLTATSNVAFPNQDGVGIYEGELVLVKNQSSPAHNGLYVLTTQGGAVPWVLTRQSRMDTDAEMRGVVAVVAGTTQAGTLWILSSRAVVVGTSAVAFLRWHNVWRVTALPPGLTINPATGLISGAMEHRGPYVTGLYVSSDGGATWSEPVMLTFAAVAAEGGRTWEKAIYINRRTGMVSPGLEGGFAVDSPILRMKSGDDEIVYVIWHLDGRTISPEEVTSVRLCVKREADRDAEVLVIGGGEEEDVDFEMIGTAANAAMAIRVKLDRAELGEELEVAAGAPVLAVAEVQWTEANPTGLGVGDLTRTSSNFTIQLDDELVSV